MEDSVSDAFYHTIILYKPDGIKDGTDRLHRKRPFQNPDNKLHHPGHRIQSVRLTDHLPSPETDLFPKQQKKCRCTGDHAQSSDLNKHQHDPFADQCKLRCRYNRHQSGHTDARNRSEQSIQKRNWLPV